MAEGPLDDEYFFFRMQADIPIGPGETPGTMAHKFLWRRTFSALDREYSLPALNRRLDRQFAAARPKWWEFWK